MDSMEKSAISVNKLSAEEENKLSDYIPVLREALLLLKKKVRNPVVKAIIGSVADLVTVFGG